MKSAPPPEPPPGPPAEPRLHWLGTALADGSRARLLCVMMDGRAHTNKELASYCSLSPATTSAHLSKLAAAGLVQPLRSGRHVYHRIASAEVAAMLEHMAQLGPPARPAPSDRRPCGARRCYNHLAGRLGVAVARQLCALDVLHNVRGVIVTGQGAGTWFAAIGLKDNLAHQLQPGTPAPAKPCLDWTERREHLSGPLATALMQHALMQGWLVAPPGTRALHLTEPGIAAFRTHFALECDSHGPLGCPS